ncbi:hypothetical protein SDC9_163378 [bioreactor metagenome]|uniref:Uncharacterized protein n=1 Tax=bioreactor metagenome TaxID=1076179 RepID=A0A645FPY8_9ZZZZ
MTLPGSPQRSFPAIMAAPPQGSMRLAPQTHTSSGPISLAISASLPSAFSAAPLLSRMEWGPSGSAAPEETVPLGVTLPEILRGCPQSSSDRAETVVPPFRRIIPSDRAFRTSGRDAMALAMSRFPSDTVRVNWHFMTVSPWFCPWSGDGPWIRTVPPCA